MTTCGIGSWTGPLPGDPGNDTILSAVSGYGGVAVSWTLPSTNPHAVAYWRVFRGTTTSHGTAVVIAQVSGDRFFDASANESLNYYWIQAVSINGTVGVLVGPVSAVALPAVEQLLDLLEGQITVSLLGVSLRESIEDIAPLQLAQLQEVADRVSGDAAVSTALGEISLTQDTVVLSLLQETANRLAGDAAINALVVAESLTNIAGLAQEVDARAVADSVLAAVDAVLSLATASVPATLASEVNARVLADSVLALAGEAVGLTASGLSSALLQEVNARTLANDTLSGALAVTGLAVGQTGAAIAVEQQTRSNADSAAASQITALASQVVTAAGTTSAAILIEQDTRASADSAQASQVTSLVASTGAAAAGLVIEQEARANADEAVSAFTTTLATSFGSSVSAIQIEQYARADADSAQAAQVMTLAAATGQGLASIMLEQEARVTADLSMASQITSLISTFSTGTGDPLNAAAIFTEQQTRADADSAQASQIHGLTAVAGQNSSALMLEQLIRTDADSALALQTLTLASATDVNTAALVVEQQIRTDADEASSSQITSLYAASGANMAALEVEYQARADSDSAMAGEVSTLAVRVGVGETASTAAIITEQETRATADSAQASRSDTLAAAVGAGQAAIVTEQLARVDADGSLSSQVLSIGAATGDNLAAIRFEQEARTTADSATASTLSALAVRVGTGEAASVASILTEQLARVNADGSLASQSLTLAAATGANIAALVVEEKTRTTVDSAVSSQVQSLSATTGENTSAIQVERLARTTESGAVASGITAMAVSSGTTIAGLRIEQEVRVADDMAISSNVSTLGVRVGVGEAASAAAIISEQTVRAEADNAQAATLQALSAGIGETRSFLVVEQVARVDTDSAMASQLTALGASTGDTLAALQNEIVVRATETSATATQASTLVAATGSNTAAIAQVEAVRSTADSVGASQSSTLVVSTATALAGLKTVETASINADGVLATRVQSLAVSDGENRAGIVTEQIARLMEDEGLARQMTNVAVVVGNYSASLLSELEARITADGASASNITGLAVTSGANQAAVLNEQTARITADTAAAGQTSFLAAAVGSNIAGILSEQTARVDADGTIAGELNTLTASTGSLSAAVTVETNARIAADSASASQITTLQSSVRSGSSGSMFPSTFEEGTTYWTNLRDGDPTTIATAAGTKITNDTNYGVCLEINDFGTPGENILPKGVVPAIVGRKYRVTARFKVTAGDGTADFNFVAAGQSATFANTGSVFTATTSAATGVVKEITATFSDTAASGITAWGPGAIYLRFGLRLNTTEIGMVARVQSIKVEDVTAELTLSAAIAVASSTTATLDGDVRALYTVRTEVSGAGGLLVGGFGLAGTSTAAGGATIDFGVSANRFWVGAPSGTGVGSIQPFVVQTTTWDDAGISRPAGVFMEAAYIKNLNATHINTRGLTILDALGNVVLSAGASLNSQVSASAIGAVQTSLANAPAGILNSSLASDIAAAGTTSTWAGVTGAPTSVATLNATDGTTLSNAASQLSDIASDSKLTPIEKTKVRQEWDALYAERAGIRTQADTFLVTIEKTSYDTAFQTLGTYLHASAYTIGATPPLWITDAQLSVTTTIVGATFRTNWTDLFTARQALLNKISTQAKVLADAAGLNRPNMLPEGGFEQGATTGFGLPTGFSVQDSPAWGRIYSAANVASADESVYWPYVPVSANIDYTAHCDALLFASGGSAQVIIMWYSAPDGGSYLSAVVGATKAPSFDFNAGNVNRTALAVTGTAPATAAYARVRVRWLAVTGCTAVGVRQMKLERGIQPFSPYSDEAAVAAVQTQAASALTNKLNKNAADILTGPITLSTTGAIQAGNATNGVVMSPTGLAGYKAGVVTFSINTIGDVVVKGDISGSSGNFVGSVSINSGTWANNASNTGAFMGMDGGYARFRVGSPTQYLRYDGLTGVLEIKQPAIVSSISPSFIGDDTGSGGTIVSWDTAPITMSVTSGGLAPYTYLWELLGKESTGSPASTLVIQTGQGTATVTLRAGMRQYAIVSAELKCTVIDSGGRPSFASIQVTVERPT